MKESRETEQQDRVSPLLSTRPRNGDVPRASSSQGAGEGMDRKLDKKLFTPRRIAMAGGILAFVVLVVYGFMTTTGGRKLNVERDKITVSTVEEGPFQEFITITGNVLPRTTVYLDAIEGGRVEELYIEEGAYVEEGDPILQLSNRDLQLSLLNSETARIEQINLLEQTRFQIEQNNLNVRQQLVQMDYQILTLERDLERNTQLYEKGLLAEQEYHQVKDEYDYLVRRRQLTQQSYHQDSARQALQLEQMQRSIEQMDRNFALVQERLNNLTVRAPVEGQLSRLVAEIGEIHPFGYRFGQVDTPEGNKVRAGIDEFYITRVSREQKATTQAISGQEYRMTVDRVYPEVRDGRFEVDLEFVDEEPAAIRRGQTIRLRLELGDPEQAVMLAKGGFYQSTGGNWVYVVDPSGERAVRRYIRLGRQNSQVYEVLEGLEPGEQVVTSSYDTFGDDIDQLVLQ